MDIPLQHSHERVLRDMRRPHTRESNTNSWNVYVKPSQT